MVPTVDTQSYFGPTQCFPLRLRPNIPDLNITDVKVQTAFWKREVISSGHEPGAHKHNPGPALPGGYSSLFPRGCTNGGGSPAHHSPLSLRRSQGNSGAVQGTPPPRRQMVPTHLRLLGSTASPWLTAHDNPPPSAPPFPALMGQNKSSAVKSSFALSTQVLQLPRKPPENTGRSLLHVPGAPVSLKLHNPPCLTATPTLPGHGRV